MSRVTPRLSWSGRRMFYIVVLDGDGDEKAIPLWLLSVGGRDDAVAIEAAKAINRLLELPPVACGCKASPDAPLAAGPIEAGDPVGIRDGKAVSLHPDRANPHDHTGLSAIGTECPQCKAWVVPVAVQGAPIPVFSESAGQLDDLHEPGHFECPECGAAIAVKLTTNKLERPEVPA